MGLDLSGTDAELDALGEVPRDLDAWSAEQARELRTLSEIDAALTALAAGVVEPSAAPRLHQRSAPQRLEQLRPKSGEIDLGEPVQRRRTAESSELTLLDSDRPRSGSFELPDQDLRTERNTPDVFASPKRASQPKAEPLSLRPPDGMPPQVELTPLALDAFDSDSDDNEERKLIALFTDEQVEPDTVASMEARDPDAEFDALFDEATHPSGIPTSNALESDDEASNADDLLSGLSAPAIRESDALTSALFSDIEPGDATQLADSNTLAAQFDPFPSEEELGSSEFEIVLDEDGEAKDLVPSHPPDESHQGGDKRPSFLGRLFGRKDEK